MEIVANRGPEGPTAFTVIIDGRPAGTGAIVGIGVTVTSIDPGFDGADGEWVRALWDQTAHLTPNAAAEVRAVVAGHAERQDIPTPGGHP